MDWLSKWHSYTAGIQNSNLSDRSVKLHVGVTTDDHRCIDSAKGGYEAIFRRQTGETLSVVSRGGVAKQHVAQSPYFDAECCTNLPLYLSSARALHDHRFRG